MSRLQSLTPTSLQRAWDLSTQGSLSAHGALLGSILTIQPSHGDLRASVSAQLKCRLGEEGDHPDSGQSGRHFRSFHRPPHCFWTQIYFWNNFRFMGKLQDSSENPQDLSPPAPSLRLSFASILLPWSSYLGMQRAECRTRGADSLRYVLSWCRVLRNLKREF